MNMTRIHFEKTFQTGALAGLTVKAHLTLPSNTLALAGRTAELKEAARTNTARRDLITGNVHTIGNVHTEDL